MNKYGYILHIDLYQIYAGFIWRKMLNSGMYQRPDYLNNVYITYA